MISHTIILIAVLLLGIGVGAFYFGGLWWTVSRLPQSKRPYLFSIASFIVRAAAAVCIFYLVARYNDWQAIIACLAGFLIARFVLVRHYQPPKKV